jgi:hypothetical protein
MSLLKIVRSFVKFLLPFICLQQLSYRWKNFHEILFVRIFRKYLTIIQVSLHSYING